MTVIPAKLTSRLLDSTGFMNWHYGATFNTILTINFGQLGIIDDAEISHVRTKLNCALSRQVSAAGAAVGQDVKHHFIYAMENSRVYGLHMHELLVAPGLLAGKLKPWLANWAVRNFGNDIDPKAVHVRSNFSRGIDSRIFAQAKLVRYILKTTEDDIGLDRAGQPVKVKQLLQLPFGRTSRNFHIKRIAGSSQSISYGEQLRWSYEPDEHWEDLLNASKLYEYHRNLEQQKLYETLRQIEL